MGNYLDIIRQVEEDHKQTSQMQPAQAQSSPAEALLYAPGDRITWQVGAGGKVKGGMVDFLHTYHDEVWVFCTLPDGGWTAVNVKYIRKQ
jgi:hypothetical protein